VALQLVGEGKLSLDDSVERWLPGLVPSGRKISVRQLLNMRSGLYDYLNEDKTIVKRFEAGDRTYRYKPIELVRIATAHKPHFAPGTGWSYCNTCYVLIGLIVEKATGHSIGAELRRRIFVPLRLRATSFETEPQIAGRHAHGYLLDGKRLADVSFVSPSSAWAAGAMVSTVDDLERFFSALNGGRLLRPELMRAMRTTSRFSEYGLGLGRAKAPCGTMWGNNGNFVGYNATAYGSAGGHLQFVVFVNLDESAHTLRLRRALDRLMLTALCGG
jgi:D-alanyl-D-alanine carboxypeptidase